MVKPCGILCAVLVLVVGCGKPPEEPPPDPKRWRLQASGGTIETRHAQGGKIVHPGQSPTLVAADWTLVHGPGSSGRLIAGRHVHVFEPSSTVVLGPASSDGPPAALELRGGAAHVLLPDDGVLRISSGGVAALARGATASVENLKDGLRCTVARGKAELSLEPGSVKPLIALEKGQRAVVESGAAKSEPVPQPELEALEAKLR